MPKDKKVKPVPLKEVAERIYAYLKRFEADPVINALDPEYKVRSYYGACALAAGRYVNVRYISYQGTTSLERPEAEGYLAWLDAGNVGTHYKSGHSTEERKARERREACEVRKKLLESRKAAAGVKSGIVHVAAESGHVALNWYAPENLHGEYLGTWAATVHLSVRPAEPGISWSLATAKAETARRLRELAAAVEKAMEE